jgi:hypothetical protein
LRIATLQAEVSSLRIKLENQRKNEITFLNRLRHDALDLKPIKETATNSDLESLRDDLAICVREMLSVVLREPGKDPAQASDSHAETRYLDLL